MRGPDPETDQALKERMVFLFCQQRGGEFGLRRLDAGASMCQPFTSEMFRACELGKCRFDAGRLTLTAHGADLRAAPPRCPKKLETAVRSSKQKEGVGKMRGIYHYPLRLLVDWAPQLGGVGW